MDTVPSQLAKENHNGSQLVLESLNQMSKFYFKRMQAPYFITSRPILAIQETRR